MTHGSKIQLSERERDTVTRILARFEGKIGPVKVYGSRATGRARLNSDLDLVIYPPFSTENYARLADAFETSDLPIKVDMVGWASIDSQGLRREIERHSVDFPLSSCT